jgi:hypothetical protein
VPPWRRPGTRWPAADAVAPADRVAMNTPLKLAAFGLGLVAVFGAAMGAGSAMATQEERGS